MIDLAARTAAGGCNRTPDGRRTNVPVANGNGSGF
jgi:hypothetical protein